MKEFIQRLSSKKLILKYGMEDIISDECDLFVWWSRNYKIKTFKNKSV